VFHYLDTRSQQIALGLLSEDNTDIMVYGYEHYQKSCDEYEIKCLGRMAHGRRKLKDVQAPQQKEKTGKADQAIADI